MLATDPVKIRQGAGIGAAASSMLRRLSTTELQAVARLASGLPDGLLSGPVDADEVVSAHNDKRTVGIVRCAGGIAMPGERRAWSAVAKLIDPAIPAHAAGGWVRPQTEAAVYEARLFSADGLGFRPARSYLVSHQAAGGIILWLEDLSGAAHAPFDLAQLRQMLRQLGQWNGHHLQRATHLPFAPAIDSVAQRWRDWALEPQLADFLSMRDGPALRTMYGDQPPELAVALRDALLPVNARAVAQPKTLCFGDCNIGNLFWLPGETVAVDWASLTLDPLGVDAGALLGSAITWGRDAMAVLQHERALYADYVAGLGDAGWRGDRTDLRRAYLMHFGCYLLGAAIFPAFLKQFDRARVERRAGVSWDELPALNAPLVGFLPGYIDELAALA